jgi:hypothetical protein
VRAPAHRLPSASATSDLVENAAGSPKPFDAFIPFAGLAGLLVPVFAIVINIVLLAPPPDPPSDLDTPIADVAAYVVEKGDMLALGHGLRYVAQVFGLIFAVGIYRLVRGPRDGAHRAWATVGLLAAFWIPAVAVVAQSLEGVAVWQAQSLAEQPQLAVALFGVSTLLWNSLLLPFSVLLLGFSLAGRGSGAFPVWLVVLGLAAAGCGLLGAFVTASTAGEGWVAPFLMFAVLVQPWMIITSVLMIRNRT